MNLSLPKMCAKISLIIICVISIFSCQNTDEKYDVKYVKAQKLNSDLFIGLPVSMKKDTSDSILWISDFSTDYLVSGVNVNNGKVLQQIIQKGNGPLEMLPPVHIFVDNHELYLYDRIKRKMYNSTVDSILKHGTKSLKERLTFSTNHSLIHKLTDSLYLSTGYFDKRFSVMDYMGQELYQTGELPSYWNKEKSFPSKIRSMYHQTTRYAKHPSLPIFAVSTSDIISIYNYDKNGIDKTSEILLHDYSYRYENNIFISTYKDPNIPLGIRDIACDTSFVYVLYNPNSENDSNSKTTEIRVYNWDGLMIQKIIPDVNFNIMALDIQNKRIFGVSDENLWQIEL